MQVSKTEEKCLPMLDCSMMGCREEQTLPLLVR